MTAPRTPPEDPDAPRPATALQARLLAVRLYLIATFPTDEGGDAALDADPPVPEGLASPFANRGPRAGTPLHPDDLPAESVRWTWRVADAVRGGAGAVQVRVKSATGTALRRELLRRLRAVLPPQTLLLVNDDPEAVHDERGAQLADGLHLGREDATAHGGLLRVRRRFGANVLLGTSTRTLKEVAAARDAGADHAGFGAMCASATKSDTQLADPAELTRALKRLGDFPLFPIGGLGPATLELVRRAGGRRAAIGSAILDAPDPAAAARACLKALGP